MLIAAAFSIVLSAQEPHDTNPECTIDAMTVIELLEDHGFGFDGWCKEGAHTMGPDELLTTMPQSVRPRRNPIYEVR